jgi:chromosome segregation ATPase
MTRRDAAPAVTPLRGRSLAAPAARRSGQRAEVEEMKAQLAAMTAARDDLLDWQSRSKTCIARLNALLTAMTAQRDEARKSVDVWREARHRKAAQLAAMTAERDQWQAAEAISSGYADGWCEKAKAAKAQLAAMTTERDDAQAEIVALRYAWNVKASQLTASQAALRKYGRHRPGCTQTIEQISEYACNCGLAEALAKGGSDV